MHGQHPQQSALRGIDGVLLPEDAGYDELSMPWNLAVSQRPLAVAAPDSISEVSRIVAEVSAAGFSIAPQVTGHGAWPLAERALGDAVLLRLHRLTGVEIDEGQRTARVLGGTLWREVVEAAASVGLAGLHGSAGDVAVSGYVLGGGLSFFGRAHGLAAHHVRAFEVVTATGELVRASVDSHAELFWALQGGGGNFGAVVASEIDLFPITDAYAGFMLWDLSRAEEVLRTWGRWSAELDTAATTSLRLMRFPPIPELPPFLSGRRLIIVDGAVLADDARAEALLAPLRALEPEMDTFTRLPAAALLDVHMDPPQPSPGVSDHAMLGELTEGAIEQLLAVAGAGAETAPMIVELRHLGGALAEPRDAALASLDGEYALLAVDMAPIPELVVPALALTSSIIEAMDPWHEGTPYLNFLERVVDTATVFELEVAARLRSVRQIYDPRQIWVAAHPLPTGS